MGAAVTRGYEAQIAAGELSEDDAQRTVIARLDALAHALKGYAPKPAGGGLLDKLFGGNESVAPPKGVYIHGDVGRGKTMLMDMFYDALDGTAKRRQHFLEFMQDVHARIHAIRGQQRSGEIWEDADPVKLAAGQIAKDTHVLAFDEFQVNDITDAMILSRLFEALFALGVVLVTTSNVQPDGLYHDGLNRNAFEPFIGILKSNAEIVSLDSPTDYRLGRLAGNQIYLTPLNATTGKALQALWLELTETEAGAVESLTVKGRELIVPQAARGVARFSFAQLCEAPLGAADYIAIAANYRTVFIEHIPVLGPEQPNEAKRFITLIDTLYDRASKLIASAAAPPENLYPQGPHQFEFDRTISRLNEMQSQAYFEEA